MPKVSAEHKGMVKDAIIEAAIPNFTKNGFDNTKMDDIAKTADVSKGTLYLYFPSKEELFYSICKYSEKLLVENRAPLFRKKQNLASDLGQFYDNYVQATKETEKIWIEAIAESPRNPKLKRMISQHKGEIQDSVTEFLKYMKKEGGFFQKNVDLTALATGMIALYNGLTLNRIAGKDHETNKDVWIKTMSAIFFGTGN